MSIINQNKDNTSPIDEDKKLDNFILKKYFIIKMN